MLDYSQLLTSYIKESKLSLLEICQRLENKGVSINRTYLSKIKTGAKPPASDELSRALAEVTGGDPEALVIAGYVEKSPAELKSSIIELNNIIHDFIDIICSHATPLQIKNLLLDFRSQLPENPYIQRIAQNIESEDGQTFEYSHRLAILATYASKTFKFSDKLKILTITNLFYINTMLEAVPREQLSSDTLSAPLNETLSEDESELLKTILNVYRVQKSKLLD